MHARIYKFTSQGGSRTEAWVPGGKETCRLGCVGGSDTQMQVPGQKKGRRVQMWMPVRKEGRKEGTHLDVLGGGGRREGCASWGAWRKDPEVQTPGEMEERGASAQCPEEGVHRLGCLQGREEVAHELGWLEERGAQAKATYLSSSTACVLSNWLADSSERFFFLSL